MDKRLRAEHGVVCRLPGEPLGYFGWPTVARLEGGRLLVASSGLRSEHICPWGKTVLHTSDDGGATWSAPRVIQDSPLDDRDAGVVDLGHGAVLVSWFTSDTRLYAADPGVADWLGAEKVASWRETLDAWTDELVAPWLGSWVLLSGDAGETWSAPIRVPVSTPHGPIRLRSGDLLYLGKPYGSWDEMETGHLAAARSHDGGRSWETVGTVAVYPGTHPTNYYEPHVVELPSGHLVGMIRIENHGDSDLEAIGIPSFSLMQTDSEDGGASWSVPRPLGFHGSPPHLLRHSSGALVLTYGYRQAPYGQRVALSYDEGATWDHDWVLRDDGPDGDLGYPSTVELPGGGLLTVAYQKVPGDAKCSLLWSRWKLP
jgi:sialidase-1